MIDFYNGMDISFLPENLDHGMMIRDFDGSPIEPFKMMKKYGVNSIRLRIWNEPELVPEAKGYCSFQQTLAMAKKIKANDLHFLLDFHYSDFWADPGQQRKPHAWKELSFNELEKAVYDYTREVLLSLEKQGVLPDMVQIGNEIRSGLLFPEGEVPNYQQMVKLINAGIRAARDVAGQDRLKVMIHLDQGGRYSMLKEWFDRAIEYGLMDFDVMGLSYYPFWHGTFSDLKQTMGKLLENYGKPIIIVETAHAWRMDEQGFINEEQEKTAGVKATPQGQYKVLNTVMNLVASLPEQKGQGIYYWEPLCIPQLGQGGWSANMGLLDKNGQIMEGMKAFLFTREDYNPEICLDENLPKPDFNIEEGQKTNSSSYNFIRNADWKNGMEEWQLQKSDECVKIEINSDNQDQTEDKVASILSFHSLKNFTMELSQTIRIPKAGRYHLEVELMGTDTTGVNIALYASSQKERKETIIHPSEHNWTKYVIREIECETEELRIGVTISSPPIYGKIRNFALRAIEE